MILSGVIGVLSRYTTCLWPFPSLFQLIFFGLQEARGGGGGKKRRIEEGDKKTVPLKSFLFIEPKKMKSKVGLSRS